MDTVCYIIVDVQNYPPGSPRGLGYYKLDYKFHPNLVIHGHTYRLCVLRNPVRCYWIMNCIEFMRLHVTENDY